MMMRVEALKPLEGLEPLEGESMRDKTSPSSFRHQLEQNILYDDVVGVDDDGDDDHDGDGDDKHH